MTCWECSGFFSITCVFSSLHIVQFCLLTFPQLKMPFIPEENVFEKNYYFLLFFTISNYWRSWSLIGFKLRSLVTMLYKLFFLMRCTWWRIDVFKFCATITYSSNVVWRTTTTMINTPSCILYRTNFLKFL